MADTQMRVYRTCEVCGVQIHRDQWDLHDRWHNARGENAPELPFEA